jgi:glycosyltransferase EpsF
MGKMAGGGVESVVMNYYRHIDRKKVQFDFIVDADSTDIPRQEIKKLGGKVIIVPPYQKLPKHMKKLETIFRENKYRIVHSHVNTLSIFPLRAAKKAGVPVRIAHSHSTAGKGEWKRNIMKYALRPFSKVYPTHYFACGEYSGRWLFGDKTFDRGLVTVIPNAIDKEKFKFDDKQRIKKRKELDIKRDQFVIGHVGRFMSQKNHDFLIDIFSNVLEKRPKSVLLLIGDGPLRSAIEQKVSGLGLRGDVRFLGARNDVEELLNAMDIFVLPSLYEGLPVVAVEAQASGVKCLLSDQVTSEADISSATEFLPINNPKVWSDKLTKTSMSKRHKLKQESYLFDINTQSKSLENIYIKHHPIKKTIAFIVNSNIFSGAEKVNLTIVKHLSDRYDFLWVGRKGPIVDVLDKSQLQFAEISKMSAAEIRRIMREHKPDILHATDYRATVTCALACPKATMISHLHNNVPWLRNPVHPNSLLYLLAASRANTILTVSDSIAHEYVYAKQVHSKVRCIGNPLSTTEIVDTLNKKVASKRYDICFVGRLTHQKNPQAFINIVHSVSQTLPNIKAVMIGDGELQSECESIISAKCLKKNIKLVGFQKNPYQYMQQSKIFCLPSRYEGFGLVVFEALALGTPCVVTPVGGLVDFVDNDAVRCASTEKDFVDAVLTLLTDKSTYHRSSITASKKSAALHNIEQYANKISTLYESI